MTFDNQYTMSIRGEQQSSSNTIGVINPATEEVIAQMPDATREQLDAAVDAANSAFPSWSKTPFDERRKLVIEIAKCLEDNRKEFSELITAEQGKSIAGSDFEVDTSAAWCRGTAQLTLPITVVENSAARKVEVHHVPVGVVGAITPWNVPIIMAIWKIAPALLAGNTVVLKPSPYTPLSTLKLGELLNKVLPAGVVNIVSGGDKLGPWMTNHPGINKVSFTGSTATGRLVMESASKSLKRVTLELGGNDAAIVLADVDPKEIAPKLFWGAFFNSAQVCVCAKRLYIHEDIYDDVARELVEFAKTVTMGDGSKEGIDLGPVQNKMQFEKVKSIIQDSHAAGHRFLIGGEIPDQPGYFIPISIVDNPSEDSRVVVEEAFGPILPLLKFKTVDEAVERANNSDSALAASVWSNDVGKATEVAKRLEAGTVWINEIIVFSPNVPFSGHKQSGLGTEHGLEGLLEFTNTQTISINKGE